MDTSGDQPTSYVMVNTKDTVLPLADLITKLHGLDPVSSDHVSIYRVPPNFRQLDEKSYTPQMVSVGPFHHGKAELQPWEVNKLRYLQAFLARTGKSLEDCIELVKGLEGRARACYRERIDMTSNAFVEMMLVDSSFIIEAVLRFRLDCSPDYLSNPELILLVRRDIILLENQIPFFVLQGLFHLGFSNTSDDNFLKLSIKYFSSLVATIIDDEDIDKVFGNVKLNLESGLKVEHFTDLLRICHIPTNLKKPNSGNLVQIPNAARLRKAGMKLKFRSSKCLIDIKFNNGSLEMPKFRVDDASECLLKNIVAFETCHHPFDSYIIDYILFMDMFIDTATDVDFLVRKGVILNRMSDNAAVASLFNNVGKGTSLFGSYYFTSISNDMNAYYKVPWHKWKATFKRDYCSSPWIFASTVAAIILLVLTLIQTICSVISLF